MTRLSPAEARDLFARGDHDLVDVREPHEWARGRIPGARHVPLGVLAAAPRGHLRDRPVIFVCAHGMRSQTACDLAERAGVVRTFTIDGGTVRWTAEGLAFEGAT
jgi:rhodanese-related sulfurtransferase